MFQADKRRGSPQLIAFSASWLTHSGLLADGNDEIVPTLPTNLPTVLWISVGDVTAAFEGRWTEPGRSV